VNHIERLRTAANLVEDIEIQALMFESIRQLEEMRAWKYEWAKASEALYNLDKQYRALKQQLELMANTGEKK
jgi:hypothetical protein